MGTPKKALKPLPYQEWAKEQNKRKGKQWEERELCLISLKHWYFKRPF